MNIFLIGYRCTGKTSVGKSLAKAMEWSFVDADSEVVKEQGMTISEMVSDKGWDFFREKERDVITRLCLLDKHVVGTGGGVILNPENVKDMRKSGTVVWLRASPETIRKRILQDESTEELRPALTSKGFVEEIEETLATRTPLYENAMDFHIDLSDIAEICKAIIRKLDNFST